MMNFVKEGVKNPSKEAESLKKCIPLAENLSNDYNALTKKANSLQEVTVTAVMDIEKDNLQISKKEEKDAVILRKIKRILMEAKKVEGERCNSKAMSDILNVMKMIEGFKNNLENDFAIAMKAMSAASMSMKFIKTMALEIRDFWRNQVLIIEKVRDSLEVCFIFFFIQVFRKETGEGKKIIWGN